MKALYRQKEKGDKINMYFSVRNADLVSHECFTRTLLQILLVRRIQIQDSENRSPSHHIWNPRQASGARSSLSKQDISYM